MKLFGYTTIKISELERIASENEHLSDLCIEKDKSYDCLMYRLHTSQRKCEELERNEDRLRNQISELNIKLNKNGKLISHLESELERMKRHLKY